jgi:hypothetical protein
MCCIASSFYWNAWAYPISANVFPTCSPTFQCHSPGLTFRGQGKRRSSWIEWRKPKP